MPKQPAGSARFPSIRRYRCRDRRSSRQPRPGGRMRESSATPRPISKLVFTNCVLRRLTRKKPIVADRSAPAVERPKINGSVLPDGSNGLSVEDHRLAASVCKGEAGSNRCHDGLPHRAHAPQTAPTALILNGSPLRCRTTGRGPCHPSVVPPSPVVGGAPCGLCRPYAKPPGQISPAVRSGLGEVDAGASKGLLSFCHHTAVSVLARTNRILSKRCR